MTLGIIPVAAGKQVIVTFEDHQTITSNTTVYTFSGLNFGSIGLVRYLAVFLMWQSGSTPTVTIGGVSATQMGSTIINAGSGVTGSWFVALVPTGTSGSVVAIFGTTHTLCTVSLYSITGISSVTPHSTTSSTAANPTATLNIPVNSAVLAGAAAGNSGIIASVNWTGVTKDSQDYAGVTSSFLNSAASINVPNGNASLAVTATFSATIGSVGSFIVLSP